ncbi:hypothetical protein [Helicobacter burdigaliensis]|uniref:hypothetical protein n=1 Tax=Helicobacter burdigaliensis TaxID=2315334 RepID=UPI000EF6F8CC|nr:hypothetical protein [Helicobacter burdigaliensis]
MKNKFILLALFLTLSVNAKLGLEYQNEVAETYLGEKIAKEVDKKYCDKGLIEACISQANSLKELSSFETLYKNACQNDNDAQACNYELLILRNKIEIFTSLAIKEKSLSKLQNAFSLYDTLIKIPSKEPYINSNIYKGYYLLFSTSKALKTKENKKERLDFAINIAKQNIDFYKKEQDSKVKFLELYQAYHFLVNMSSEDESLKEIYNKLLDQEKYYRNQFWNIK